MDYRKNICGQKQPVMDSEFRMLVERMILKFREDPDEKLEFPKTFNKQERDFIQNYVYKIPGLKSTTIGKGASLQSVVYKNGANLSSATNHFIDLRTKSKIVANKILEMLDEPLDKMGNNYPLGFPKSEAGLRYSKSIITVPKISFNPNCVRSRMDLPVFKRRKEILELINSNQVTIIESSTGSGKSTQIPQCLLEQAAETNQPCRIIVAEPKRICATTLANRVSYERGEKIGETVGYQIRLESKVSPSSNLIFVTNGVILRMLMSASPEEFFRDITTLIVDEVHERNIFTDFLLLCIREYLPMNPNLKLIIMSATIQSDIFSQYFGGCPTFKLEGQSFSIKERYLEDVLRFLKFTTPEVEEMKKNFEDNPEMFTRKMKKFDAANNPTDDTKYEINEVLANMTDSSNIDREFYNFFYMVQADQVPVDFIHTKTNKTALMFAVEYGFADKVSKLLSLNANPNRKLNIAGKETTPFERAVQLRNEVVVEIIKSHLEKKVSPNDSKQEQIECSPFERQLLDIYYDTLIQPGVNRGVFLEDVIDLNLIVKLVYHLHVNTDKEFGILIFLPGHDEIIQLANLLCNALDNFSNIFILHSQINTSDQRSVFETMPKGIRKIVIATNIAESSITVNDVVFVIDSGKEKQKFFNPVNHVSSLTTQWISKASAKQRKGRAGRLRDGYVYRMYSRDRYNNLIEQQKPEFLRCDLTDICLQAKMIAFQEVKIGDFLKKAISPPSAINIEHSIKILQQLGAMHYNEKLTHLGRILADIPLNAKYGKMLIYAIFFKCLDPILTIVSILSVNEPFMLPLRQNDREKLDKLKRKLADESFSDHFVMLKVFQHWNKYITTNEFDGGFCEDNFVNSGTMQRIASTRQKILGYLRSIQFIPNVGNLSTVNENSCNWSAIKACISAGSYPEVARILKSKGEIISPVDSKLIIQPGSVLRESFNTKQGKEYLSQLPSEWMFYEEKNLILGLGMARTCTLASSICIAFTAGVGLCVNDERSSDQGEVAEDSTVELEVDKFIKFSADSTIAYVLQEIRRRLTTLLNNFLMNVGKFEFKENDEILIAGVVKILELEDEKAGFKVNYDGIGLRPRIVTRDNRDLNQSSLDAPESNKENIPKLPSRGSQRNQVGSSTKNMKTGQQKVNTMRYFMVEMKPDLVKLLKSKVIVLVKADAELPDAFIDAVIESEVNDRISKKVLVFFHNTEILGAGLILSQDSSLLPETLKMFFQSEQRFNISELNNFVNPAMFKYLFKSPFAEMPFEIGKFCVEKCITKPAVN